jgi:hypothetical protein
VCTVGLAQEFADIASEQYKQARNLLHWMALSASEKKLNFSWSLASLMVQLSIVFNNDWILCQNIKINLYLAWLKKYSLQFKNL